MAEDLNGVKDDLYRAFNKAMQRVDYINYYADGPHLANAVEAAARAGEAIMKIEETLADRDPLKKPAGLPGHKP